MTFMSFLLSRDFPNMVVAGGTPNNNYVAHVVTKICHAYVEPRKRLIRKCYLFSLRKTVVDCVVYLYM